MQVMASNGKGGATDMKGTSAMKANASETPLESAGKNPVMNEFYFYLVFCFDRLDRFLT